MHEVITLQLGQRSNFAATHFWNLQESYFTYADNEEPLINHDIHFRAGIGADGIDTFTPRTVIYDLKGGFGSLRKNNALYEISDDSAPIKGLWDGTTATQQQQPIEPSRYQRNLDLGLPTFQVRSNDVRYWSDFNRVFYHPRSVVQLNEYELNSQLMPFENWSAGEDLYQSLDKEFDLLDRDFRPFAEECDQLQAIQLITGADDAWGGFGSKYLDSLRDEFGKTSVWIWGLEDGRRVSKQKQIARASNSARSLRSLGQQASAYVRIATPPSPLPEYICVDGDSEWLDTALVTSALESCMLPTRLAPKAGRHGTFALFEAALNTNGQQNIFELEASLPEAQDNLQENPSRRAINFSHLYGPLEKTSSHIFSQIETHRHISQDPSSRALSSPTDPRMQRFSDEETIVEIFNTGSPFPLLDTFPETLFRVPIPPIRSIAFNTTIKSTARTREVIFQLRNLTSRSMDLEEREAIYNDLTELGEAYSHGWDSGSDSGEDE